LISRKVTSQDLLIRCATRVRRGSSYTLLARALPDLPMAPKDLIRALAVIVATISISTVHYFIPDSRVQLHYLIQRLFYIPVVYAGLYFGWKGG
jgi:hypothetical protein